MSRKKAAAKKEDPAYGFAQKRRTPTDSGSSSVFSIAQGGANVNSRLEHAPEKENADGVYDLYKVRASNLFSDGRVQFPAISDQAGLIYSIFNWAALSSGKSRNRRPKIKSEAQKTCTPSPGCNSPVKAYRAASPILYPMRAILSSGKSRNRRPKKVRASNLTGDPRVQFPSVSEETGLIYSISDADSPVKRKASKQSASAQQKQNKEGISL